MEEVVCLDLGTADYAECWELQQNLFDSLTAFKNRRRTAAGTEVAGTTHGSTEHGAGVPERMDGGRIFLLNNKSAMNVTGAGTDRSISPATVVDGHDGCRPEQYLLLCEHPAVYTLGKSGDEGNMLVGEEFLRGKGASFFRIDRGGDITFHGPGQLVGYPILDLEREGLGLREYIHSLEQVVIDTVAEFGISGTRVARAAGVWLVDRGPMRKICAIGVRSSRYVTMHGFALNANTDLRWFDYINPCGFADRGVTSIAKETGKEVDMNHLKKLFAAHFQRIINVKINIEDYANRQTLGNQAAGRYGQGQ